MCSSKFSTIDGELDRFSYAGIPWIYGKTFLIVTRYIEVIQYQKYPHTEIPYNSPR